MRAWLEILRARHPGLTWISAEGAEERNEHEEQAERPVDRVLISQ
jgi:hypothetical protein